MPWRRLWIGDRAFTCCARGCSRRGFRPKNAVFEGFGRRAIDLSFGHGDFFTMNAVIGSSFLLRKEKNDGIIYMI